MELKNKPGGGSGDCGVPLNDISGNRTDKITEPAYDGTDNADKTENMHSAENTVPDSTVNKSGAEPQTDTEPQMDAEQGTNLSQSAENPFNTGYKDTAGAPQNFHWNYSDQNDHDIKKIRRKSGVLTYAIIMTIAFAVCLVVLLGVVLFEQGVFDRPAERIIYVREYDKESGVLTIPEIAEKVKPSVVGIEVKVSDGILESKAIGTGIILSEDGYIATNYHVVENSVSCRVFMYDDKEYEATYIGGDELSDLALLKINAKGLKAAEIGNSDELIVGETVVAIGTPARLDFAGTTTNGIVSAIGKNVKIYDDKGVMVKKMAVIQTNASVNPGNSGGPLVNDRGQVVGIIFMKLGNNYDDMGFAIPINGAKSILDEIKENGSSDGSSDIASRRAVIGITARGIREGDSYTLDDGTHGTAAVSGVLIVEVDKRYDAAEKLHVGDIILEIDGRPASNVYDVMDVVNNKYANDNVTVKYYRDGSVRTVSITLGSE